MRRAGELTAMLCGVFQCNCRVLFDFAGKLSRAIRAAGFENKCAVIFAFKRLWLSAVLNNPDRAAVVSKLRPPAVPQL